MLQAFDKKICVVGLGYIGLPTAAVLASRGYQIHGFEVSARAVEIINAGKAHVVEPDLDILVRAAVQTGKLKAATEPAEADIFMLCVPTPCQADHEPDLSYVEKATRSICPLIKPGNLIILESTSPPGTTEMIAEIVKQETGLAVPDIYFAHAPERVLPGKILREVVENDRIVGGLDDASTQVCAEFYGTFVSGELHLTNARTAETAKLVENAFRDVNIAFANELSLVADELGLDVWRLIELANKHPRVNILMPGPGVGGHCIAVDPWFLISRAPNVTPLIKTAREVNEHKPQWIVERVKKRAARFKNPRIACLGLAYKPDIDDLRESPAVTIVRELQAWGNAELRIVEPNLTEHAEFKLANLEDALRDADIVVVLVAHRPFKWIPSNLLSEKIVIDTCGAMRS
ncbi:MAG: UDP-N-acetyl-D-mannosamine dehydrogenase [Phycisphaeraceae bacterium]